MNKKEKLLIVHHRHQVYRQYLEDNFDLFDITSFDFRDPVPFDSHDTQILFCWKLPQGLLARLPRLRWIAAASAGVDHIIQALPEDSGILVTRSQGTMPQFMAEYSVQHMLNHIKNYHQIYFQKSKNEWRFVKSDILSRYTLGILGLGSIGTGVARLAKAFGMRILASKFSDKVTEEQKSLCDSIYIGQQWREMLQHVDFLVLTVPQTQLTRNMLSVDEFKIMKNSALLINLSRGSVVVEEELVAALQSELIAGAVLDVFNEEPLPPDHPFWNMENVVVTPHCSGPSEEDSMCEELVENYRRWKSGSEMNMLVSFEKGY